MLGFLLATYRFFAAQGVFLVQYESTTLGQSQTMSQNQRTRELKAGNRKASSLTGVGLCKVDRSFYDQFTVIDVENQLQLIIGFVHEKEAIDSVVKETYKQCEKKLLEKSVLFSDNEVKYMFISCSPNCTVKIAFSI